MCFPVFFSVGLWGIVVSKNVIWQLQTFQELCNLTTPGIIVLNALAIGVDADYSARPTWTVFLRMLLASLPLASMDFSAFQCRLRRRQTFTKVLSRSQGSLSRHVDLWGQGPETGRKPRCTCLRYTSSSQKHSSPRTSRLRFSFDSWREPLPWVWKARLHIFALACTVNMHIFCVRYRQKCQCLRDRWFVFDAMLVCLMVALSVLCTSAEAL